MERSSKEAVVAELILEVLRLNGQLPAAGDRLSGPLNTSWP